MISSVFNTSAANSGNATMRAACIPWDFPVELILRACGPNEKDAYIEVSSPSRKTDPASVHSLHHSTGLHWKPRLTRFNGISAYRINNWIDRADRSESGF